MSDFRIGPIAMTGSESFENSDFVQTKDSFNLVLGTKREREREKQNRKFKVYSIVDAKRRRKKALT